jgi:RNA recognition motif-containing protein
MSFTVFLGNLPLWVTADDIKSWLAAENLVADNVKVIRNPETQESKGFAFIDSPNSDEMNSIIRRFDRAPLEDRLLRANPAQPPKGKGEKIGGPSRGPAAASMGPSTGSPAGSSAGGPVRTGERRRTFPPREVRESTPASTATQPKEGHARESAPPAREGSAPAREGRKQQGPRSAFAEELAKAL